MSLRIAGGVARGRSLRVPAGGTRPTSERARSGLFNRLDTLIELSGSTVLDLYAGSGAVGLEAVSRGAAAAVLVDSDRLARDAIRVNLMALPDAAARVQVMSSSVVAFLGAAHVVPGAPFDVVFADPPYTVDDTHITALLSLLALPRWTSTGAVIVLERSSRSPGPTWPARVAPLSPRKYGEGTLWYGRVQ